MTADRWAEHARRIAEALELGLDDCDPENDFSPGQVYVDAQASLAALLDELARLRALSDPPTDATKAPVLPETQPQVGGGSLSDTGDAPILREHAIKAAQNALRNQGYAVAVHGSLVKDVDLIAVPWRDTAIDAQNVAEIVAAAIPGFIEKGSPEEMPNGRLSFTIRPNWHYGFDSWYIDLAVMPRGSELADLRAERDVAETRAAEAEELAARLENELGTEAAEARCHAAETRAAEAERDEGEAWAQWNEMAEKLAQAEARSAALEAKLASAERVADSYASALSDKGLL